MATQLLETILQSGALDAIEVLGLFVLGYLAKSVRDALRARIDDLKAELAQMQEYLKACHDERTGLQRQIIQLMQERRT